MILTGENRSSWRQACPNAALVTTDPLRTGLRFRSGLRVETTTDKGSQPWHDPRMRDVSASDQEVRRLKMVRKLPPN